MASVRVVAALLSGTCLAACNLPTPDYKVIQYPAPYRKDADGAVLDNETIRLDAEGYRLNRRGERIALVDIPAKTAREASNPVAGYYISSQGDQAPGRVMVPSEGGASGAGFGPGSAQPFPAPEPPPVATGRPVILTPPR